jgi:hypothetical protein
MLPAERLGRIFGALLAEGRPRTLRGQPADSQPAGGRPRPVPPGDRPPLYGDVGPLGQLAAPDQDSAPCHLRAEHPGPHWGPMPGAEDGSWVWCLPAAV